MATKRFQAVLHRPEGTGTWTYVTIPFSVPDAFGGQGQGQVRVKGTINGSPFRNSLMPTGDGSHYLVVNKEIRDQIGAAKGSLVDVVIELDTEERTVAVPNDLLSALDGHPLALSAFARLSYSRKKEFVTWIEESKREETRQRRITFAVERIAQGLVLKG